MHAMQVQRVDEGEREKGKREERERGCNACPSEYMDINFDLHYNSGALDLTDKLNLVVPIEPFV